ncbi:carbon-nitrogen hydrolase family protein [Marinomonas spartinae]|uniref:carbon-nitrogen hydrolase family protein n=1 Tax=Marinomonas spartinae TaxID=1792290 RepID=UPI0018F21DE6|nr:carbon-nitrogen hydrolase family protein [Marinomonas spartinae]MBJ7555557.1 carbon-nitrogen hydrolase family protein [Marinomonas spartinae]
MSSQSITVSLAQIPVVKGAVDENLTTHLFAIARSAAIGADLVVFPELSLTGYELELAAGLAFHAHAPEFAVLSKASIENNIIVIAGCPCAVENGKPTIGAVICFPDGRIEHYAKQYLHDGEDQYCSIGTKDYVFLVGNYRVALGICADFSDARHPARAAEKLADLYVASALISESGYEADAKILSHIAAQYQMPVMLSNHISQTGGWQAFGHNAAWDSSGQLAVSSNSKEACLLVCTLNTSEITGYVIA